MTAPTRNTVLSSILAFIMGFFGGHVTAPSTPPVVTPPPVVVESTVTPPPVVTPPPPSTGTVAYIVSDDFSKYTSTANLLANVSSGAGGTGSASTALYSDGYNAQYASIDPTVKYNGHQTVKYTQPAGTGKSPALWASFHKSYKHIWYKAVVRFQPGFTTAGTTAGVANAYKLLGWGFDLYDGSGRVEITNTTQYYFYWNALSKSGGAVLGGGTQTHAGDIVNEWTDGKWYVYVLDLDFSKSPVVTRLWIGADGTPLVLRAATSNTMQGSNALPGITGIMLGLNINNTLKNTQALWFGEFDVADGGTYQNPFNVPGI